MATKTSHPKVLNSITDQRLKFCPTHKKNKLRPFLGCGICGWKGVQGVAKTVTRGELMVIRKKR
ncbi:hypothetical protein KBC80_00080 [Candidatus Woesebacteria bacterium]|nr:hypothetical protein [Candidatus Woesebacteria bacterium]